jgi:hypothetical protein
MPKLFGKSPLIFLQTYGGTPIDKKTSKTLSYKNKKVKSKENTLIKYCPICKVNYEDSFNKHRRSEQHIQSRLKKMGYEWIDAAGS